MGRKSVVLASAASCSPGERPRARIVAAACDLFHRHGIRSIGVDTIAEAAGTNKMTLYRHFGSKDELVCEWLGVVAQNAAKGWETLEAAHPGDPKAQLRAWVRHGADRVAADGRGCALANAAVELTEADHPARPVIEAAKARLRERLAALCAAAGAAQPELLADTLSVMIEGARVSRQSCGTAGPSAHFARMGEAVLAAFGAG